MEYYFSYNFAYLIPHPWKAGKKEMLKACTFEKSGTVFTRCYVPDLLSFEVYQQLVPKQIQQGKPSPARIQEVQSFTSFIPQGIFKYL